MSDGSLWAASATNAVHAPPLAGDRRADLVVIGGGFTGCAAALQAAAMGASVCLIEAQAIGHGGSGRNVGLVNAGLWLPPETVIAQMGAAAGDRLLTVLADAPRRVFDLIERHHIECEATRAGTLHLAHAASGLADLRDRHAQGVARGAPLQLLDRVETARRTGTAAYHGALFDPRAGTIQPLSYVRGLARAAIATGARLFGQTPASGLRRDGADWIVTASGYQIRTRAVLVATNAYHLGINGPFRPEFISVSYCQFATAPLPDALRASLLPGGEGCWDTATVMSSFRMDRAGRMIIGGIGNAEGPGGPVHAAWARRKLARLFPALKGQAFDHAWRGRIAMTSDHVPKIVEFGPGGYACFGYSGRGIGPGTVFGTEAAKALLSGQTDGLPLDSVGAHHETAAALRAAYYETGAVFTHAVSR